MAEMPLALARSTAGVNAAPTPPNSREASGHKRRARNAGERVEQQAWPPGDPQLRPLGGVGGGVVGRELANDGRGVFDLEPERIDIASDRDVEQLERACSSTVTMTAGLAIAHPTRPQVASERTFVQPSRTDSKRVRGFRPRRRWVSHSSSTQAYSAWWKAC